MLAEISAACSSTRAEVRSAIALEAAVPGAGKTYLIKAWLERTGQKTTGVIVCPWNALVTQLVRDGFRVTLHELVGRNAVESEEGRDCKKAYNLEGNTYPFRRGVPVPGPSSGLDGHLYQESPQYYVLDGW